MNNLEKLLTNFAVLIDIFKLKIKVKIGALYGLQLNTKNIKLLAKTF